MSVFAGPRIERSRSSLSDMSPMVRRRLIWGLFSSHPGYWDPGIHTLSHLAASFYSGFTNYNILNFTPRWVGTENYADLFTSDNVFWGSLRVTIQYVAIACRPRTVFDICIACC